MQFQITALVSLAAFSGLAQSLAVEAPEARDIEARGVSCYSGPKYKANGQELHNCINEFISQGTWFGTVDCAGRSFFLGGSAWSSAADCMGGCTPCLSGSADLSVDWAKCNQQTGVDAHCWFGWCPEGMSPGGNSDGSCS